MLMKKDCQIGGKTVKAKADVSKDMCTCYSSAMIHVPYSLDNMSPSRRNYTYLKPRNIN